IAIFEAEHGLFGQARVEHFEARLALTEMVERRVALLGILIEKHCVALREGAALAVLARQAYGVPLLQQGAECKRLGRGPIDPLTCPNCLCAVVEETLDGFVDMEIRRNDCDFLADLAQHFDCNTGIAAAWVLDLTRRLQAGPAAVEPVGLVRLVALRRLEFGIESRTPVATHLGDLAFS